MLVGREKELHFFYKRVKNAVCQKKSEAIIKSSRNGKIQ